MNKKRYYYDESTATYKDIKKNYWLRALVFILTSTVFGFVISIPVSEYRNTNSPEKQRLRDEITLLEGEYSLINERFETVQEVLSDIQRRDDNLYRLYFNADPISKDVRQAGYGGVNRYKDLEGNGYSNLVINAHKKLDKLSKQLTVQSKSLDEVVKLAKNKDNFLASIPAIQPISKSQLKRIASGYGMRIHPILRVGKMHWGIDFSAPTGSSIYATANGKIVKSMRSSSYGNIIEIDHGFGYLTRYAHMHKRFKEVGATVKRGDIIGQVGSTGLSSGPHLHYELELNGQKINPIGYFYQDLSPDEFAQAYEQAHNEIKQSLD